MKRTKHFDTRMTQRAISLGFVRLTLEHGIRTHDNKVKLDRREIRQRLAENQKERKILLEAEKKGGIVVVEDQGVLITTYSLGR